jgi:vacuolar-type H+-ATPase subunit H
VTPADDELAVAGAATDVEALLRRVADLVTNARPMPLSASVMINRDEVLELLEQVADRLPEELRQARWLLRERDEFLAKVQRQGDDILDEARVQAERMVQRTEVVRAAQHTARRTIEDAEVEARRLRHEAEDYCDQKLAEFEVVLDRTQKTVQAGRARLQGTAAHAEGPTARPGHGQDELDDLDAEFFDQDST